VILSRGRIFLKAIIASGWISERLDFLFLAFPLIFHCSSKLFSWRRFGLGGPSFSSAVQDWHSCGLQPLKLQGLKPLSRRRSSSGLKSRPPMESFRASLGRLTTVASEVLRITTQRKGNSSRDRLPRLNHPNRAKGAGESTNHIWLEGQLNPRKR
jgi:hypothetical protein